MAVVDPEAPAGEPGVDFPVVIFDGDCGFCNASVLFALERDGDGRLHFAAAGGELGSRLLARHGLGHLAASTVVLIEDGRVALRSSAALGIAAHLTLPWRLATIFRWIPACLRDAAYDRVAQIRRRLPGRVDVCRRPEPSWAGRILH